MKDQARTAATNTKKKYRVWRRIEWVSDEYAVVMASSKKEAIRFAKQEEDELEWELPRGMEFDGCSIADAELEED